MIDTKTISKYYLNEAIEEVIELVKLGYELNPKDTYRLGSSNQISMIKKLSQEESELLEANKISTWEDAQRAIGRVTSNKPSLVITEPVIEVEEVVEEVVSEVTEEEVNWRDFDVEGLKEYALEKGIKIHHKASVNTKIIEAIEKGLLEKVDE